MSDDPYTAAEVAATEIRDRLGPHDVLLVLGSGWAGAAESLGVEQASVPMPEFSGFPAPAVQGHSGALQSRDVDGVSLLVMAGRAHFYEGHPIHTVVHGVRSAVGAGCTRVILTNAAGSLRDETPPGSPVVISDHVNLTGANPMTGPAPPSSGPDRFVDLVDLYSPRLRAAARAAVPGIAEGVYAGLLGGSYETPAEIRMLQHLGADLVGMSTVLEAIAAKHLGAEVFGASLVTNMGAGLAKERLDHGDVLAKGAESSERLADLLRAVVTAD